MKELAQEEGISINSFIVSSISNEVVRQETRDFFKKVASSYDPEDFADALAAVPDVPISEAESGLNSR